MTCAWMCADPPSLVSAGYQKRPPSCFPWCQSLPHLPRWELSKGSEWIRVVTTTCRMHCTLCLLPCSLPQWDQIFKDFSYLNEESVWCFVSSCVCVSVFIHVLYVSGFVCACTTVCCMKVALSVHVQLCVVYICKWLCLCTHTTVCCI